MTSISELRMKEVINLNDGRRLGFIEDFEINLQNSKIEAIIVPKEGKFLKLFSRDDNYFISWKKIVKIGQDVILVDLKETNIENEKMVKGDNFLKEEFELDK